MFAIPLATIPLAAWVGEWRARVAAGGGSSATLKMALAWLVSLNVAWSASANAIAGAVGAPLSPGCRRRRRRRRCDRTSDFAALAALPATTVLAISNLGAPILNHTHHRVLSGPYHRNVAGDVLTLQAFMGSEAEAAAIVERQRRRTGRAVPRQRRNRARCRKWAPAGFIAALAAGAVPAWLERLPGAAGEPLEIYRVRKQS